VRTPGLLRMLPIFLLVLDHPSGHFLSLPAFSWASSPSRSSPPPPKDPLALGDVDPGLPPSCSAIQVALGDLFSRIGAVLVFLTFPLLSPILPPPIPSPPSNHGL